MRAKVSKYFYIGLIPSGIEHLELEVQSLRNELDELRNKDSKKDDEKKRIVMGNGKEIRTN